MLIEIQPELLPGGPGDLLYLAPMTDGVFCRIYNWGNRFLPEVFFPTAVRSQWGVRGRWPSASHSKLASMSTLVYALPTYVGQSRE